jgi:hypothetical protein
VMRFDGSIDVCSVNKCIVLCVCIIVRRYVLITLNHSVWLLTLSFLKKYDETDGGVEKMGGVMGFYRCDEVRSIYRCVQFRYDIPISFCVCVCVCIIVRYVLITLNYSLSLLFLTLLFF